MKIGQLSFVQLTEPAETPYGSGATRLEVPGPAGPDAVPLLAELRRGGEDVILVTGGSGFVGGHVVQALRADGRRRALLVRDRRRGERLEAWGCELVEGDVTEPESLPRRRRRLRHGRPPRRHPAGKAGGSSSGS